MGESLIEERGSWNSWLYNFSVFKVPAHDLLCQRLEEGRRAAVNALPVRPGLRTLEVGVGSGLSLQYYPAGIKVTGIDPNATMLEQAKKRARHAAADVTLEQMRGEDLKFPDASFDAAVMVNVLSVADDPQKLLEEAQRVTRPKGSLIVVNAFHQRNAFLRFARWLLRRKGMIRTFGFHTDLREEDITMSPGWRVTREEDVKPSRLFVLEKI